MGKTHCFTCFKMRLHLGWSTTIFSQLPHMRTTISPDLWIVYIPMNRSTCILTLKESKKSCKAQKGKNGQNALFHLLQNAPTPGLIYHDFLSTSTHAHNYITRSLDSLHPNEQVYMHFNIKRVEKVVLRRKKAKLAKRTVSLASKCAYTWADLPWFSPNFHTCAQLYHPIFG